MNIEEILDLWKEDAKFDKSDLASESLNIPLLHHKYYQIFIDEKQKLLSLQFKLKKLKTEKYEFYSQGPSNETIERGWQYPAKGIILKSDIPMYMESDEELMNLQSKIEYINLKCSALESILRIIMNRSYFINNAIEFNKWTGGS